MTETVGTLLWQMRTASGWTQGKLAQKAGVSKAALSQWEAGKRQPRVDELQSVLDALNASAAQRALVFARIQAPRANRYLREQQPMGGVAVPPTAGDLLRAMRLRKRWPQERLAAHIGVDRTSVGRWERSERLPNNAHLHDLCYALDAQVEEILALTRGHLSVVPLETASLNWTEQQRLAGERLDELTFFGDDLPALRWLLLERDAWQLAMQHEATKPLLVRVLVGHAWYNRNQEHWGEIEGRVQRAFAVIPPQEVDPHTRTLAALIKAAAVVNGGARPAPQRGLAVLQRELDCSPNVALTAWMLSDMAKYAAMAGQTDASLILAKQACQTAERSELLTEVHLRRCDYGGLLLEAGRPEEALHVLPPVEAGSTWARINVRLLRAEAHRQLNHFCEAHDQIQQAYGLIGSHSEMQIWRPKADLLAHRF